MKLNDSQRAYMPMSETGYYILLSLCEPRHGYGIMQYVASITNERYCVDYPAEATGEYHTIFNDVGWELAGSGNGWYIWRAQYTGHRRPELFNDVEPLIERNNRLLALVLAVSAAQVGVLATNAYRMLLNSTFGKVFFGLFLALLVFLLFCAAATNKHNKRLQARRP